MARTIRGRREAYDNIAVGQAVTAKERIISGSLPPSEVVGGGSNIAVGSAFPTTIIADDQQVGVVTMTGENVKVGG